MLGTRRNGDTDRNLHLERRLKMLNGRQEDNPALLSTSGIRRAFVEIAQKEKTPENARLLTEYLRSYLIQQPHAVKRSEVFLNWAHKNILFVHSFCCQVADVTKTYILDHYMIEVLKTYVRLECEYSKESEERVTKLLWSIYKKYCFYSTNQSSDSIVWEMIYKFLTFELPTNIPKLNAILDIIRDFLPAESSHPELPYYTKNSRTFEQSKVVQIDLTDDDNNQLKKGKGSLSFTRTKGNSANNLDEELSARLGQLPRLSRQSSTEVRRPAHYAGPCPQGPITRSNLKVNTMINLVDDSDDEDDELTGRDTSRPQGNIAMRMPDNDVTEILTPRQDVVDLTEDDDFRDNIVSSQPITKNETVDLEECLVNETDSLVSKVNNHLTGSSGFSQSVEEKDQSLPTERTTRMNYKVRETEWPRNYGGACAYPERRFVVGNALWRNNISMRTHREDLEVPFSVSDCSQMSNSSQDYIPVEPGLCLINDSKPRVLQTSKKDSSTQTLDLLDEGCQTDETIYFCPSSQSSNSSKRMQSSSMHDTFSHGTSKLIEKSNKLQNSVIDPVNLYETSCHCQKETKDRRGKPVLRRSLERIRTSSGSSLEEASFPAANHLSRDLAQPHLHRMCKKCPETNIHLEDVNYDKSDRVQKSVISNELLCTYCHHQKGSENNQEVISIPRPFHRVEKLSKAISKQESSLFRDINTTEIREQASKLPTSHKVIQILDPSFKKLQENIKRDESCNDSYRYQKESGSSLRETSLSRPFERFGNITAGLSREGLSQQFETLQLGKRCRKLSLDMTEKNSISPQSFSSAASCVNTNTPLSCNDENSVDLPATVFPDICPPRQNLDLSRTTHDLTTRQANTYVKDTALHVGRSLTIETESERFSKALHFPGDVSSRETPFYEGKTKGLAHSQIDPICVNTSESNTCETFLTSDTAVEETSKACAANSPCVVIDEAVGLIFEGNAETKRNESILWMRRTTADLVSSSTDVGQPLSPSNLVEKLPANKLPYDSSLRSSSNMKQSASEWTNDPSDVSKELEINSADTAVKSSVMVSSASETERPTEGSVRTVNPEYSVSSTNTAIIVSPHVVGDSIVISENKPPVDIPSHPLIKSRVSKVPTNIANTTTISVHAQISLGELSTSKSTDVDNSQVDASSPASSTSCTERDSQRSIFISPVDKLSSETNLQKSEYADKPVNTDDSRVVTDFENSSACFEAQDRQSAPNESLFQQIDQDNFQVRTDSEKSASHGVSIDEQINEMKSQTFKDVKSSMSPLQQDSQGYSQAYAADESSNVIDTQRYTGVEKSNSSTYQESLSHGSFTGELVSKDDIQLSEDGAKLSANPVQQNIQTFPNMSSVGKLTNDVHLQTSSDITKPRANPIEHMLNCEETEVLSEFSESNMNLVQQGLQDSTYQTTGLPQQQLHSSLHETVSEKSCNKAESQVSIDVSKSSTSPMQRDPEADVSDSFAEDSKEFNLVKSDLLTSPPENSEGKPAFIPDSQRLAAVEISFTSPVQRELQTSSYAHSTANPNCEDNYLVVADHATSSPYESLSDNLDDEAVSRTPAGVEEDVPIISSDKLSEQDKSQLPVNEPKSPKACIKDVETLFVESVAKLNNNEVDLKVCAAKSTITHVAQTPQEIRHDISADKRTSEVESFDHSLDARPSLKSVHTPSDKPTSEVNLNVLAEESITNVQPDLQIPREDSAGELTCLKDNLPNMPSNEGHLHVSEMLNSHVHIYSQETPVNEEELKVARELGQRITVNNEISKDNQLVQLQGLAKKLGDKYPDDSTMHQKVEMPSSTLNMANRCDQITTQDCSEKEPALPYSRVAKRLSSTDKSTDATLSLEVDVLTSTDPVSSNNIGEKPESPDPPEQDLSNHKICQARDNVTMEDLNSFASANEQVKNLVQPSQDLPHNDISQIKGSDLDTEYLGSTLFSDKVEITPVTLLQQNTVCTVGASSIRTNEKPEQNSVMLLQEYPDEDISQIQKIDVTQEYANSSADPDKLVNHPEIPEQDVLDKVKDSGERMEFSDFVTKEYENPVQLLQESSNENITQAENVLSREYESASPSLEKKLESSKSKSQDLCHEDVPKVEGESPTSESADITSSEVHTDFSHVEPNCITTETSIEKTEKQLISVPLSQDSLPDNISEVRKNDEDSECGAISIIEGDRMTNSFVSENCAVSAYKTIAEKQIETRAEYIPQSRENYVNTDSSITNVNTCSSALAAYYEYVSLFLEEERKASGVGDMIPDPFQIISIASTKKIDSERIEHNEDVKQEGSSKHQVEQIELPKTCNQIDEDSLLGEPEGYLGHYKEMDEEMLLQEYSEKDRQSSCPKIETIQRLSSEGNERNDSNKTGIDSEAPVEITEKNLESEIKDEESASNAIIKKAEMNTDQIIVQNVHNGSELEKHKNGATLESSEMVIEEASLACDEKENRTEVTVNNVPKFKSLTSVCGSSGIKILSNIVLKPAPLYPLQDASVMPIPEDSINRNSPQNEVPGSDKLEPVRCSEEEECREDGLVADDNVIEAADVRENDNTTTGNTFRDLRDVETLLYTPGYSTYTQEQLMILKEDSSRTRDDPRKDIYALRYNSGGPESDVLNLSSSVKHSDDSSYVTVSNITETKRQGQIVEPRFFAEQPVQSVQPTAFVEQPIQSNESFLNNNILDWRRSGASEVARVVPTIVNPLNLILDAEHSRRAQETIETCSPNHFPSTCQGIRGAIQKAIVEPSKVPCNYFQGDHSCSDNKLMALAGIALQYGNSDAADSGDIGDITLRHGNGEATDSSDSEMKLKIDEGRSSPETVENNWKAAQNKVPVTPKRTNKKRRTGIRLTPKRLRTKAELKCMPSEEQSSSIFSDDDVPLTVRLQRKTPSRLFLKQDTAENAKNTPFKKSDPGPFQSGSSKRGRPSKSSVRKGEKPSARGARSKSGTTIRRRSSPELQEQFQKDKTSPEPAYTSKLRSRSQSTSDKEKVKEETNIVHSKQKSKKGSPDSEENIKSPKIVKPSAETSKKKECIIPPVKTPLNPLEIPGNHTSGRLPIKPSLSLSEETFSKHTLASSPPKKRYFLLEKKNPYLEERTKRLEERLKEKDSFDQNNKDVNNLSHTEFHSNKDSVALPELIKSHEMGKIGVPVDDENISNPEKCNVESNAVQEITLSIRSEDNEVRTCSDVPSSPDDLPLSQLSVLSKIAARQTKENIKFTTPKEVETLSCAKSKDGNIHLVSEIETEVSKQDSPKSATDFVTYNNELDDKIIDRVSLERGENSTAQSNESKNSNSDTDCVSVVEFLAESSENKSNQLGESDVIPCNEFKTNTKADTLTENNPELTLLNTEKIIPALQNNIETIKFLEIKIEKYDVTTDFPKILDEIRTDTMMKNSEEEMSIECENDIQKETHDLIESSNKEGISATPESETRRHNDSVVENNTHLESGIVSDTRSVDLEKSATTSYTFNKPIIEPMVPEEHTFNTGNINDKEHCPNDFPTEVALSETVDFEHIDNNLVEEIYDENINIVSNEVVVGENDTEALHVEKEEQLLKGAKDDIKTNSSVNENDIDVKTNTTSETCLRECLSSSESSTKDYTVNQFSIAKIMQPPNIDNNVATEVTIDSQLPKAKADQGKSPELPISSSTPSINDVKANDDIQNNKSDRVGLSFTEKNLNDIKDKIALKGGPDCTKPFDVECKQNEVNSENSSETHVQNNMQENHTFSEKSYVSQVSATGIIEHENSKFETTSEDLFDISNYEIIDETTQESIEVTSDTISNKSLIEDSIQSTSEGNCVQNIPVSDFETCGKETDKKAVPQLSEEQPDVDKINCSLTVDEGVNDDITHSEYQKSGLDHPDLCDYECEIEVHSENNMDEFSEALANLNTTQDNVLMTNEDDMMASDSVRNDVEENSEIDFQVASEIVIHENTSVKVVSYCQTNMHNDLDSSSLSTNVSVPQDSDSEIEMQQKFIKKRRKAVPSNNIFREEQLGDDENPDNLRDVLENKSSSNEDKSSESTMAVEKLNFTPKDESHKKSYDTIKKVTESKDRPKDRSKENYERRKTEKSGKSTSKTSLGGDTKNEEVLDIHKDKDQRQSTKKYDRESKTRERSRSSREKSEYSRDKGKRRSYDKESKTIEKEIKKSRSSDSLEKKLNNDEKSKVSQVSSFKESSKNSKDDRQCGRKTKGEEKSSTKELRISEASKKNDEKSKLNKHEKTESVTGATNYRVNETNEKSRSSKPQGTNKDQNYKRRKSDEDLKSNKLSNQLKEAKSSVDSPKSDTLLKDSGYRAKKSSDGLRRSERFNPLLEGKKSSDSLKPDTLNKDQSKNSKNSSDDLETNKNSIVSKSDISNTVPTDKVKKTEKDLRTTEIYGPLLEAKSSSGGPDTSGRGQSKKDKKSREDKLHPRRSSGSPTSDVPSQDLVEESKNVDPGLKESQIYNPLTGGESSSDSPRLNSSYEVQSKKVKKSEDEQKIKRSRNSSKSDVSSELYIPLGKSKSSSSITRPDTPFKGQNNKRKKSEDGLVTEKNEPRSDTSNKDLVDKAKKSDEVLRKSGQSSCGSKLDSPTRDQKKKLKTSENKLEDRSTTRNKDPVEVKNSEDRLRRSERYSPLVEPRRNSVSSKPDTSSKGHNKKLDKYGYDLGRKRNDSFNSATVIKDAIDEVKKSDDRLGRTENFNILAEGSIDTSKYMSSKADSKKTEKSDNEFETRRSSIGSKSKASNKKQSDIVKKSDDGLRRSERNVSLAEIRTNTPTKDQSRESKKIDDELKTKESSDSSRSVARSKRELVDGDKQSEASLIQSERNRLVDEAKINSETSSLLNKSDKSQGKNKKVDELETKKSSDCTRTDVTNTSDKDRTGKMKNPDDGLRRSERHTPLIENKNRNHSSIPDTSSKDSSKKIKNFDVEFVNKESNVITGSNNHKLKKSDEALRRSERCPLVEAKISTDNSKFDGLSKDENKTLNITETPRDSHDCVPHTLKKDPVDKVNKLDDGLRKSERDNPQSETKRSGDSSGPSNKIQSKKFKKSTDEQETKKNVENPKPNKSNKDPVDKVKKSSQGLRRSERNSPLIETRKGSDSSVTDKSNKDESKTCKQTDDDLTEHGNEVLGGTERRECTMADISNNKDQNQKIEKSEGDELKKSVLHNQESNRDDRDSSNTINKNENKNVDESKRASDNNRNSRISVLNIYEMDKVEKTDVDLKIIEQNKQVVTKHIDNPKLDASHKVRKSDNDLKRSDSPKCDKPSKNESHRAEKTDELKSERSMSRRKEKSSKPHDQNICKASKMEKAELRNADDKQFLKEQQGKQSNHSKKGSDSLRNEKKRESSRLLEKVIDKIVSTKKNSLDNKLCSGTSNETKTKLKEPTENSDDCSALNDQKKQTNDSEPKKDNKSHLITSSGKILDGLANEQSAVSETCSFVLDKVIDEIISGKEDSLNLLSHNTVPIENQLKETTEKLEHYRSKDNEIKKTGGTRIKNEAESEHADISSSDNKAEILSERQTSSNVNHPGERKLYIKLDNRVVDSATQKSKKRKSDESVESDSDSSSAKLKKAKTVTIEINHDQRILDDTRKNRKRPSSPECVKESKKVCVEPLPFSNDFDITCTGETPRRLEHVAVEISSPVSESNTSIAENEGNNAPVSETKLLSSTETNNTLFVSEHDASVSENSCAPVAKSEVLPDLKSGISVPEMNSFVSESIGLPGAENDVLPNSGGSVPVPEVNLSISDSSCSPEARNNVLPNLESGRYAPEINSSATENNSSVTPNSECGISVSETNSSATENNSSVIESNLKIKPPFIDTKESTTETNFLFGAESSALPVSETKVFASQTTWLSDAETKEVSGTENEKCIVGGESLVTESNSLSDVEMTALPILERNKSVTESNMLSDPKSHLLPTPENNISVSESKWISDAANNGLIGLESDKSVTGVNSIVMDSNSLPVVENNMSATESNFSTEAKIGAFAASGSEVSATESNLLSDAVINALATSNSDTLIVDTNLFSHAETNLCVTDTNIVSKAECKALPVDGNDSSVTDAMLSDTEADTLSVIENNPCITERKTVSVTKTNSLSIPQNNSDYKLPLDTQQTHSLSEGAAKEVACQLRQTHSKDPLEDKNGAGSNETSLSDYLAPPPLIFTSNNTTPLSQSAPDQQSYEEVYSGVVDSAQAIPEQQPYENVYTGVLDFFGITETVETTPLANPDLLDFAFENVVTTNSSSFSNSEMQLGFRSNDLETFHGSQFNPLYQGSSGDGITVSSVASSLSQTGSYQTIPVKASQGLIQSTVSCTSLCPTKQIGMSQCEDHSYADVVETIKKFQKSVHGSPVPTITEPVVAQTSAINSLIMETGGVEYSSIASPGRAVNSEMRNASLETAHSSSEVYQDKSNNCITVSSVDSTISQTTSYQTIPLCTSQDLPVRTINSATHQKDNPDTDHTSTMDSMIGGLKSDSELVETTLDIGNPNCSISSISGSLESDSVLDESNLQPALDLFSFQSDRSMYNDIRFLKNIIEEVTGGDSEPDLSYSFEMTDAGPRLLESEKKSVAVPDQVKKTKKQSVQPTQPIKQRQPVQPTQPIKQRQPVQPTQPVQPKLLEIPTRTSQRKKMHPPPRRKEAQPVIKAESHIRVNPPQEVVTQEPKMVPKEDVRKSPRILRSGNYDFEVCDSLAEARLRAEKFSMPVVDPHPDDLTSRLPTKINVPTSTPPSTCRESPVRLETRRATRDYQQAMKRSQNETKIEKSVDPFDQLKNEQPTNPYFKQRNNSKPVNTKKRNDNKRLKTHHSEDNGQSSPFDDTSDDISWPPVGNNVKYRGTHQAVKSKSEPYKLGFEEPYREPSRSAADDRIPHSFGKEETVKTHLNRKTDPHTPIIGPPVKSGSKSAADRRDDDQYDWLKKFPKELQKRGRIDSIRLHGTNYGT